MALTGQISSKRAHKIDSAERNKRMREWNLIKFGRASGPTRAQFEAAARRLLKTGEIPSILQDR